MNRIKIKEVKKVVFRADNSNDNERTHNVEADVTVTGNTVESLYNGRVTYKGDEPGSAMFHEFNNGESGVTFEGISGTVNRMAVMEAIERFSEQVKEECTMLNAEMRENDETSETGI